LSRYHGGFFPRRLRPTDQPWPTATRDPSRKANVRSSCLRGTSAPRTAKALIESVNRQGEACCGARGEMVVAWRRQETAVAVVADQALVALLQLPLIKRGPLPAGLRPIPRRARPSPVSTTRPGRRRRTPSQPWRWVRFAKMRSERLVARPLEGRRGPSRPAH
jgi:hypothetical protein